ncbi:MAG: hypothetical protein KZQ99_13075 [Candidatus Thiodiazotropha sp. (ex Dulcina madagascariensis)]|nr:hypothetical protein [Candidatus Thiodiazotropha sp. (ex Dulcina madagascariensis)]
MKHYSEEMLNALADDEYPVEQQVELLSRLQSDKAATDELCKLRSVKQLVKTAYQETPEPNDKRHWWNYRTNKLPLFAVASIMLAVAVSVFLTGQYLFQEPIENRRLAMLDPDGRGQQPALGESQETRIVLHLLDADMQVAGDLLDEIERLLAEHRTSGNSLRVEIVAHSEGLALLRQRLSTHKTRITRLANEYQNLAFVACLNTVRRLRVEQGIEVTLLPEASTTKSGVAHVVQRQMEGWAYIKV